MIVKWGTYPHANNEVRVNIQRQQHYNERGLRTGYTETWHLTGFMQAIDQAALTTALGTLKAAYATDGQNLILYLDDGTTPTTHQLLTGSSISGTKVISGPEFPEGAGAEYATASAFRTYGIVVQAEFKETTPLPGDTLVWQESLSIQGTGEGDFVLVPIINGKWDVQDMFQATNVIARQSGSAIGRTGYPTPPAPIFGDWEHKPKRTITDKNPKRAGPPGNPQYVEWEREWLYEFESNAALKGEPGKGP